MHIFSLSTFVVNFFCNCMVCYCYIADMLHLLQCECDDIIVKDSTVTYRLVSLSQSIC